MNAAHRLLIDGGTTHTRVWAIEGQRILAYGKSMVGARDTARDGSPARLHVAVRDLLADADAEARRQLPQWQPECVLAAGMITSPLGLAEVPHIPAPAGFADLAAHTARLSLPEVTSLSLLLVPGVRCGPAEPDETSVSQVDVMRGEEVVCLGLARIGVLPAPGDMLSVGSHWKLVGVDAGERIVSSTTTLSGELLHALRTQTVLAASVDEQLPEHLDESDLEAVRRGVAECRRAGLPRAAFCTRLLERVASSSPRTRLCFLLGVVVGETVAHWHDILAERTVALTGAPAICEAWLDTLSQDGCRGLILDEADTVAGFIAGMTAIADLLHPLGVS